MDFQRAAPYAAVAMALHPDDIAAAWHLVGWHREAVLALVQETSRRCRTVLRFDRAALIDAYAETHDTRMLARRFCVSASAISEALTRLVRFARQIEEDTLIAQMESQQPFVVLISVDTSAAARTLAERLVEQGFDVAVRQRR